MLEDYKSLFKEVEFQDAIKAKRVMRLKRIKKN